MERKSSKSSLATRLTELKNRLTGVNCAELDEDEQDIIELMQNLDVQEQDVEVLKEKERERLSKLLDCIESSESDAEDFVSTFTEFGEFVDFEKFIGDVLPWLRMHGQLKPVYDKLKEKV